jgi:hypothetical protein
MSGGGGGGGGGGHAGEAFSASGVRSLQHVPSEARAAFARKVTRGAQNVDVYLGGGTGFLGYDRFLGRANEVEAEVRAADVQKVQRRKERTARAKRPKHPRAETPPFIERKPPGEVQIHSARRHASPQHTRPAPLRTPLSQPPSQQHHQQHQPELALIPAAATPPHAP